MTYKSICPKCGDKLQTAYTRSGVMVKFCPHVPAHIVKTGIGNMRHLEVYCDNGDATSATPQRSTAIYDYKKQAKANASTDAMREAFDSLTENSGVTFEDLREAVASTVPNDKLLKYANLAIMLELPTEELPNLFNAAMKLGFAMGISTEASIRALSIGVGRQSRLVLDNIGIVFKAKDAYKWFQKEHADEDFDRVTAWKRYALKLIVEKASKLSVSALKKTRFEKNFANLEDAQIDFGEKVLNA